MLAHFSSEQLWRGLLRVACIAGVCVRAGEQRSTEWERIAGRRPALSVVQRQHGLEHTGVLTILPSWSTQSWAFQGVRALCVAYKIEVAWQHNQQSPPAGCACGYVHSCGNWLRMLLRLLSWMLQAVNICRQH